MGRPVVHWELWSNNPDKVASFYKKVFDWTIRAMPEMKYTVVETGGEKGINGGIMTPQKGPWPGNMSLYIDVDDLDAYMKKVREAGGKILVEKQDVGDAGQFSLFEDPDGRCMGLWKQIKKS